MNTYDPQAFARLWSLYEAMNAHASAAYYTRLSWLDAQPQHDEPEPKVRVAPQPRTFLVPVGGHRVRDDRRRQLLASIPCASCGAATGEPCFSRSGGEISSVCNWHDCRQRAFDYRTGVAA